MGTKCRYCKKIIKGKNYFFKGSVYCRKCMKLMTQHLRPFEELFD
jgi:hypothetical protein